MVRFLFLGLLSGFGLLVTGSVATGFARDPGNCEALRKDVAFKRQQLSQHVDALRKLNDQNELSVMVVFNDKIRELIEDIQKNEALSRLCGQSEPTGKASGLNAAKSEMGDYATKNCDELRTLLLQLVQKTAALKRREGSLFSGLTPAEKSELQDADRTFKELKAAIKTRCPLQDSRSPVRDRRR